MRVKDSMSAPAIAVGANVPLVEALDIMLDNHLSGLPVVDECGELVGMLSEGDVLRRTELGTANHPTKWFERLFSMSTAESYRLANGRKVSDVMSTSPITIGDMAPLSDAATLMEKHRIKRLAVMRDGELVGMLSRADFVKALRARLEPTYEEQATSDEEIRQRIAAELQRQPWAANCNLKIHVAEGRVTLRGTAANEHQRRAARVAAENVIGVSSVDDEILLLEPVGFPVI